MVSVLDGESGHWVHFEELMVLCKPMLPNAAVHPDIENEQKSIQR